MTATIDSFRLTSERRHFITALLTAAAADFLAKRIDQSRSTKLALLTDASLIFDL